MLSVGIIGSGPGAFYTALRLIRQLPQIKVTIYEKLDKPFGLVRFGVAPDHPEVRNCSHSFEKLLQQNPQKLSLLTGQEINSLSQENLLQHDAIVVAIGAQGNKRLGIEGEEECLKKGFALFHSKEFVACYNESPTLEVELRSTILNHLGNTKHLCIIGTGNVTIDIARILTKCKSNQIEGLNFLADRLKQLQMISIIGRRGPLQCTFTAKELRQFLFNSSIGTTALNILEPNPHPFHQYLTNSSKEFTLNRQERRIFDIWNEKEFDSIDTANSSNRCTVQFEFMQEPKRILFDSTGIKGIQVGENEFINNPQSPNSASTQRVQLKRDSQLRTIDCQFIISSIGYSLKQPLFDLPFEGDRIKNEKGRVRTGIYVAGWCKTGPQGDIANTMINAYETADSIIQDYSKRV